MYRYDASSSALFAAVLNGGGQLSDHRRRLIDLTIRRFKNAGAVWDILDHLWMPAALDSGSALFDWKAPGTFTLTANGGPTFTADRGFTGDFTDAYVATGYTPSLHGVKFTQNSAHIAGRNRVNLAADTFTTRLIGETATSPPDAFLIIRAGGDLALGRLNDGTNSSIANTSAVGHFIFNRSGASARELYKDGALLGSDAVASTGLTANQIVFLQLNASFAGLQMASGSVGGSLNAEQAAAYSAIELSYMQAIGAA